MTKPCEPIVHRTVFCQKQGAEKEEGEVSKKADLKRVPRGGFELIGTPSVVKFQKLVTKMSHRLI